MATATADNIQIIGGVDTHQDLHTAAIVDLEGAVLGAESFSTTRAGYRAMLLWFRSHGELLRVGVESTGTYGAGITRHLALSDIPVLEVTGPDPASRRAKGKDDTLDAIAAAEAAGTRRRGPGGQRPLRRRRGPAGSANDAKDGDQVPPCGPAATPQHHRRRAGGSCVTRSATSPACDACVPVRPGGRTRSDIETRWSRPSSP